MSDITESEPRTAEIQRKSWVVKLLPGRVSELEFAGSEAPLPEALFPQPAWHHFRLFLLYLAWHIAL
jgi:hypothetical protein